MGTGYPMFFEHCTNDAYRLSVGNFEVRQPHALVGFQGNRARQISNGHSGNQVLPMVGTNQIDVAQGYLLHLVTDVVNAEDGLVPAHTLTPETEQLKPEMQGELGRVRMKRRLFTPNGDQAFQLLERLAVMAQGVRELLLQIIQLPLTAVNGPQTTSVFHPLQIVLSCQQTVDIERRNPLQ